jgi:hypothetical protein
MAAENRHNFSEELIDVFDLDWNYIKTQNRKEFSEESKKDFSETWEVKHKVKSIWALLLNRDKDFLLVQRGDTYDSPWLIDKTVWGHISSWDLADETLVRELDEEIWVDWIVATNEEEFNSLLNTVDTTKIAVLLLLEEKDIIVNVEWKQPYKRIFDASIYMWVYDWEINSFPDGSALKSVKVSSDEVLDTIKHNKAKYTNSLTPLITEYRDLILSKI